MGTEESFQQIMLGQQESHMHSSEVEPLPLTIYKKLHKMDKRSKCKRWNSKT